jgi:hypothetical protein
MVDLAENSDIFAYDLHASGALGNAVCFGRVDGIDPGILQAARRSVRSHRDSGGA